MTIGLASNNPGNIRYLPGITSIFRGCTGQNEKGFCIFDTAYNGIRALAKMLRNYQLLHKIDNIEDAIIRWAPPQENNTAAYIDDVCKTTKYASTQKLDFSNHTVLAALTKAIIKHENGIQPYNAAQIAGPINELLGEKK